MTLLPSGKGTKSQVLVLCKVESSSNIACIQSGSKTTSLYDRGLKRLWIETKNDVKEFK